MEDLQSILKDLYLVSGINISMYDIDEHLITSYPTTDSPFCELIKSNPESSSICVHCDHCAFQRVKKSGKIDIYNCDFYLYEAVVPIYTYGTHTGYLMMGQTLTNSQFEKERIKAATSKYVTDEKELDEAISKISFHTREQILSIASIIDICAKYLTLTNRIEAKNKNLAMEIKSYIHTNFANDISIDDLCKYFYCSRGTLINKFKEEYGKTIHQYLLDFRLEQSLDLLRNKDLSIQEIAITCGFKDANYFSKSFRRKFSISPSEYKLSILHENK